jgi:outer membrane protein OmpA-like peptidoglycan-associated protein
MTKVLPRVGIAVVALAAVIGGGTWFVSQQSGHENAGREQATHAPGTTAAPPTSAGTTTGRNKVGTTGTPTTASKTKHTPIPDVPALSFAVSSAKLRAADNARLKQLAEQMDQNRAWRLVATGHSDNIGDGHSNLILSRQRAEAVAVRLRELGVNSSRIRSDWKSSDDPVASNQTEAGRAKNRRVTITLSEAPQS